MKKVIKCYFFKIPAFFNQLANHLRVIGVSYNVFEVKFTAEGLRVTTIQRF